MLCPLYTSMESALVALKAHPDLPPTISVALTDDGLWVTPFEFGAPITALMGWHSAMTDPTCEFETTAGGAGSYTKITVRGLLDDVQVIAQTVTFRSVDGAAGTVSVTELQRIAAQEAASLD